LPFHDSTVGFFGLSHPLLDPDRVLQSACQIPARFAAPRCPPFDSRARISGRDILGGMTDASPRKDPRETLIERAALRLAECEAEGRRLDGKTDSARRQKLMFRSERYQELIQYMRSLLEGSGSGSEKPEEEQDPLARIEHELRVLREKIMSGAAQLVEDRESLRELKSRWGIAVDEHLTRLEEQGEKTGRIPKLDFTFPPPPSGAPPRERTVHDVIRSLGL